MKCDESGRRINVSEESRPSNVPRVETGKVRTTLLRFRNYDNDQTGHVSVTDWINGDGVDVSIASPPGDRHQMFSISADEAQALVATLAQHQLPQEDD